jgi:hypothetical protein
MQSAATTSDVHYHSQLELCRSVAKVYATPLRVPAKLVSASPRPAETGQQTALETVAVVGFALFLTNACVVG